MLLPDTGANAAERIDELMAIARGDLTMRLYKEATPDGADGQ
jgi:hypothetical protein